MRTFRVKMYAAARACFSVHSGIRSFMPDKAATLQGQMMLEQSLKSQKSYHKESERYKAITRKLAIFVGSTNVPNSLVTKPEFCDLLTTADPRYIVPGRMALSCEINKVLVDLKANIGLYLHDACKVSITANIWSKKGLMSSYMGITAHFFSPKDHYRHQVMLAVRRMASSHTAERVLEVIEEVLAEWEIPYSKVSAILTDNGSNMVAAFHAHF